MDASYDIIQYRPEFNKQVLELQTELWSPNLALNRDYFQWKHERNPYVGSPLVYLVIHQDKIVGMRGFFGVRWEAGLGHQVLNGLYADDLVIARSHRDRGLVRGLMTVAFESLSRLDYDYVFNLSAGPVTFLSSLSMGWHSAGSLQQMQRRPFRHACESRARRTSAELPVFAQWDRSTSNGEIANWD